MGLFDKLFGGKKKEVAQPVLCLEYNVMRDIQLAENKKYEDTTMYELIENGIYKELNDTDITNHRMTISYTLDAENNQYPLEDILDKYCVHVSEFLTAEHASHPKRIVLELAGTFDEVQNAQEILGKKVYNQDFLNEHGEVNVRLVIA